MDTVLAQLLELGIALLGIYVLTYAAGITKKHPVTLLGDLIGGVLKAVLRLPIAFIRGLFGGLGEKHGKRMR